LKLWKFLGGPDDRITSLQIFTRWGNLVFEANNIPLGEDELGWNGDYQGERLQPDVFIYRAVIAKAVYSTRTIFNRRFPIGVLIVIVNIVSFAKTLHLNVLPVL